MKLKNKQTGEIGTLVVDGAYKFVTNFAVEDDEMNRLGYYTSLAELNAEWCDAPEEPKTHWMIDTSVLEPVREIAGMPYEIDKEIGNWFDTKEEAEKAVEKLKAYKRLKEARFEFGGWTHTPITKSLTGYNLHIKAYLDKLVDYMDDLQLLFGGEE